MWWAEDLQEPYWLTKLDESGDKDLSCNAAAGRDSRGSIDVAHRFSPRHFIHAARTDSASAPSLGDESSFRQPARAATPVGATFWAFILPRKRLSFGR